MKKEIENINLYKADLEKRYNNGSSMIDWCLNQVSSIVAFTDGKYVVIDKPQIKTSFCFDDSYDYDWALHMAHTVSRTEEYFISENLREYNEMLDDIERAYGVWAVSNSITDEVDEVKITTKDPDYYSFGYDYHRKLTDAEIKAYIDALQEEKKKLEKRLNSYWKRYGNTKLRTWTYWGMA